MSKQRVLLLAAALLALAVLARLGRTDPPTAYTLIDLGPYDPIAMNATGSKIAAHDRGKGVILSVGANDAVTADLVPSVLPDRQVTLFGMGPQGVVVGVTRAETLEDVFGPCDGPESHKNDRACKGDASGMTTLGAAVVTDYEGQCQPGHSQVVEDSEAHAINASGVAVGQSRPIYGFPGTPAATRFDGQATRLSTASWSDATAINAAGKIVGYVRTQQAQRMTLWYGGEHDIDVPGNFGTTPRDINSHDLVVGFRTNGPLPHAFATQLNGTSVASDEELPPLPGGTLAGATAVNDAGVIVGHSGTATGAGHAVVWKDKVPVDLNDVIDLASPGLPTDGVSVLVLRIALDVDAAGDILCRGDVTGPSGTTSRAYLLRPGQPHGLVVSPGVADFGSIIVGDTKTIDLVVTNNDAAPVNLAFVRPAKPFSLLGPSKLTLGGMKSRTLRVRLAPRAVGTVTSQVDVTGGSAPISVRLIAYAVGPPPSVSAAPFDFGQVRGKQVRRIAVTSLEDVPISVRTSGLTKPFKLLTKTLRLPPRGTGWVDVEFHDFSSQPDGAYFKSFAGTLVLDAGLPLRAPTAVAVAGKSVATIIAHDIVEDVSFREPNGAWQDVHEGTELYEGQEVHTGPGSSVRLEFPDATSTVVHELTQLKINTSFKRSDRVRMEILLLIGQLKAQVPPQEAVKTDFEVREATLAASVRGTEFAVAWDQATQTGTVRTFEHSVLVTPTNTALKPLILPAGREVSVTPDAVSPVHSYGKPGVLRVLSVTGSLWLHNASTEPYDQAVSRDDELHAADRLRAMPGALADLALADGSIVTIVGPALVMPTAIPAGATGGTATFDVTYGRVRARRVEFKKGLAIEVRTPSATTLVKKAGLVDVFHSDGWKETTVQYLSGKPGIVVTPTGTGLKAVRLTSDHQVRVALDIVWPVEWN